MYIASTENIAFTEEDLAHHHAVSAVIFNEQGEILIQDHTKYGFWTIPIGKVKLGQGPEEAIVVEIMEECGIELLDFKELTVFTKAYPRRGTYTNITAHVFKVNKYKGVPKNVEPDKHREQVFMPIERVRLLPRLSDQTLAALKFI